MYMICIELSKHIYVLMLSINKLNIWDPFLLSYTSASYLLYLIQFPIHCYPIYANMLTFMTRL